MRRRVVGKEEWSRRASKPWLAGDGDGWPVDGDGE